MLPLWLLHTAPACDVRACRCDGSGHALRGRAATPKARGDRREALGVCGVCSISA
ncbi:hypothetical protein XMIN_2450 [Xanthomonas citri pv. mangiferaeindicae LMG 941]|nr:hypothetical protein XMIN_2450 [Xanthomonas citri pv. mangiferaeindicae LMG 941]